MKANRKEFSKTARSIILIFALIFSTTMSSQIALIYPPPPPGLPSDSIPLDGGLVFLAIGAAVYGIKKVREHKI